MSLVGTKVIDGLFAGDCSSACDLDSAHACKVTHVVNCCEGDIDNQWESIGGFSYLSYKWEDTGGQTILDKGDFVINEIFDFVERALGKDEGVLVHSFHGKSRCCCVLAAYLMKRYRWCLKKTMEFLKSRSLGEEIKMGLMHQLQSYEKRLEAESSVQGLARDWGETEGSTFDSEELVIRNTFVNATTLSKVETQTAREDKSGPRPDSCPRPRWKDIVNNEDLVEEQEAPQPLSPLSAMLAESKTVKPPPLNIGPPARSALKGSRSRSQTPERGNGKAAEVHMPGGQDNGATTFTIQTRSRLVHCSPDEIVPKRFGLKLRRSSIILEYEIPAHELRAHHPIKVKFTSSCDKATASQLKEDHAHWLKDVSYEQLVELVGRLRSGQSTAGGS